MKEKLPIKLQFQHLELVDTIWLLPIEIILLLCTTLEINLFLNYLKFFS